MNHRNAYLVLAHEDIDMLNVLIGRLIFTGFVYVHLDKKSPLEAKDVICNPRVNVTKQFRVNWGGFSIIQATRFLADQAIADGATRLTLLSGTSFPIVSDQKLVEFSKSDRQSIGTWVVNLETQSKAFRHRFTKKHFSFPFKQNFIGRVVRKLSRTFFSALPGPNPISQLAPYVLTSGSQWWSVKSETYEKAMKLNDSEPRIENYFKKIECSDESFFGTLFFAIDQESSGHGTTYVHWGGSGGPRPLNVDAIRNEQTQGIFLFARKIYSTDRNLISFLSIN